MIKSITREELEKKTIPNKRLKAIQAFDEKFDDPECPPLTADQVAELRPRYPELYKPLKQTITLRIDADILVALKSAGKGYQSRINAILRKAVLG